MCNTKMLIWIYLTRIATTSRELGQWIILNYWPETLSHSLLSRALFPMIKFMEGILLILKTRRLRTWDIKTSPLKCLIMLIKLKT
jgi:hypothetical protein